MGKRRMMLYFGSFNPIHKGHTALAEYAVDRDLCDEAALIVSPQNPFKESWMQAPEFDRFEMAEIADFAILMGSDLINQLPEWREAESIMADYDIYVYPRPDADVRFATPRTVVLDDAPQYCCSSTEIREALERGEDVSDMVDSEVLRYIREHGLWTPARVIADLTAAIERAPDLERGKRYFRRNEWGSAVNDFNRAREIAPDCTEAQQFIEMAEEILEFRYKDIYNP